MSTSDVLVQQLITGLSNGMIIALIALGYTMVYGIIELINFAHGDLFMLGSFLALTLIGALGLDAMAAAGGPGTGYLWLVVILLASGLFCASLNWSIDRLAYKPLRKAPRLAPLVSAIGVSFVLMNIGLFWGGLPMDVFADGVAAAAYKSVPALVPNDNLLGADSAIRYTPQELMVLVVTVPLMIGLTLFVKYTRLGKAMRAVAQNPTAAALMGIDINRVIGATFFIGGALGGVASVVYAQYNLSIHFQMGYRAGMDAFTAAVLGGIGSLPGAMLGGLLIGVIRALSDGYIEARWTNCVVFGILILILVFRPSGLLGARLREKVSMGGRRGWTSRLRSPSAVFFAIALVIPLLDFVLPEGWALGDLLRPVFVFAILGLGLNIVTGFTGLLNLGVAAFMAIGAYSYAILTCEIYPYQVGFWLGIVLTAAVGAVAGLLLGAPTLRLRGDYLAIVTLGFGEIAQDVLKNVDVITKGTQGINPLPYPTFFGYQFTTDVYQPWYYLFLGILAVVVVLSRHLEDSRIGRAWVSIREDELASACMGINPPKAKLMAFALGAALCSLAGALFASSLGSSGEPGNYDFSVSIIALCIVIVGGMGNISGVLLGALAMIGLDSIVLTKLTGYIQRTYPEFVGSNVLATPTNWKLMIYGLALILMMRFKPEGLLPSRRVKAELHHDDQPEPPSGAGGQAGRPRTAGGAA